MNDISHKQTWTEAQLAELKVAPHSIEAEQAVLGGLMLDNDAWDKIVDQVSEVDFYRREHQILFKQIQRLAAKSVPFDVVTLCDALDNEGQLEVIGGLAYVGELAKNTPSAANIKAYAEIVRERSVLRQLLQISTEMQEKVYRPEGASSKEILENTERQVYAIAEQGQRQSAPEAVKDLVPNMVDKLDSLMKSKGGITGQPTQYVDLDRMLSGLQKSDLVIIAGRPSMGKTTFSMNIAESVAMEAEKPVLVFSLEMPKDQIMLRIISSFGRVEQTKIRTGQIEDHDWSKIFSAMSLMSDQMKMYIDDTPALSPAEMRARARRVARQHDGLSLIVIDYLQLMQIPGSDNRVNEVSEISRGLKALAKELNVPVIALSQLSRKCEDRTDKRPMMSDLRESGAIEQDADVIMFVYRDEVYHPDTDDKGVAEIIIGKQRNGPIGTTKLTFLGQFCRFDDYAPMRIG